MNANPALASSWFPRIKRMICRHPDKAQVGVGFLLKLSLYAGSAFRMCNEPNLVHGRQRLGPTPGIPRLRARTGTTRVPNQQNVHTSVNWSKKVRVHIA